MPSVNPFRWPPMRQSGEIHRIYAVGGVNGSTVVVIFVGLCVEVEELFRITPTVGIPRGGSFSFPPEPPHSRPFDLSFDPYPAPPPLTSHGYTSHTLGANITISSLPPKLPIDPLSPDVLQIIRANADSHLQKYERKKLGRINKTYASTAIITRSDTLIGDLLHRNMLLIPFAIDPLGRFGPLLLLFGHHSAPQLWFPPSRPNATQMYTKLLQYPSPKGILLLANHNWSLHPTR